MGIRITGGFLRGRVIESPSGLKTRPTASRTREAIFNILQDVSGFTVLDLFSGSGIIGLEAISRNAAQVFAVEQNHNQAMRIKKAYKTLKVEEKLILLEKNVLALTDNDLQKTQFDLIYADPPFTETYPDLTFTESFLAPGGIAIFECPTRTLPPFVSDMEIRRYGESSLAFYRNHS